MAPEHGPNDSRSPREQAQAIGTKLAIRSNSGAPQNAAARAGRPRSASGSSQNSSEGRPRRRSSQSSAGAPRRPGHHDYQERYTPQSIRSHRPRSVSRDRPPSGRVADIANARRVVEGSSDRSIKRQPSSDTFALQSPADSRVPSYMRSTATSSRRQRGKSPEHGSRRNTPNRSPFGTHRPSSPRRAAAVGGVFGPSSPAPKQSRPVTSTGGAPRTSSAIPTTPTSRTVISSPRSPAGAPVHAVVTPSRPRTAPAVTPKTQPRMSRPSPGLVKAVNVIPPTTPRSERVEVHRTPNWRARRTRVPHKFEPTDYAVESVPLPAGLRVSPGVVDSRLPAAKARSPTQSPVVPLNLSKLDGSPIRQPSPRQAASPPTSTSAAAVAKPAAAPVPAPTTTPSPVAKHAPRQAASPPAKTTTPVKKTSPNVSKQPSPAAQQTPPPPQAQVSPLKRGPAPREGSPSSEYVQRKETVADLYTLGEQIGEGAFSVVLAGRSKKGNDPVAVKIIDKKKWGDRMHFFRREVRVLSFIDHPSVVKLIESFETEDELVLVLELVDGGSLLSKLLDEGKLNNKLAREMTQNLLEVMQHLHERDIMHRDLKPGNILLPIPNSAELKLCDFGHAAAVSDREAERHRKHVVSGTKEYWAPEVIMQQDTGCFDKSSDVWAVGVIVFIMLCGVFPFDGYTDAELFNDICAGAFTFPVDRATSLTQDSMDFIRQCLVPDKRYRPTVSALLNHRWITGRGANAVGRQHSSTAAPQRHSVASRGGPSPSPHRAGSLRMASGTAYPQMQMAYGRGGYASPAGGYPRYR